LSETGIQSLPSLETWYQVTTNASDLQYDSAFVGHREHWNVGLPDIQYVNCSFRHSIDRKVCFFKETKSKVIYRYQQRLIRYENLLK